MEDHICENCYHADSCKHKEEFQIARKAVFDVLEETWIEVPRGEITIEDLDFVKVRVNCDEFDYKIN